MNTMIDWSAPETRPLLMPDGSKRPMTMSRLLWSCVDTLAVLGPFTQDELVQFAEDEVELNGWSFDEAFQTIVAYLDNATRDRLERAGLL